MSGFTPGPWGVNKFGSIGAGEFFAHPVVAHVEPFYGGDTVHGDPVANARLIAAAPTLYALLRHAVLYAGPDDYYANVRLEDARTAVLAVGEMP